MEIFYLDISEFCCPYLFERNSGEFINEPHICLECLLLIDRKIFIMNLIRTELADRVESAKFQFKNI